jgi:putative membrane protein
MDKEMFTERLLSHQPYPAGIRMHLAPHYRVNKERIMTKIHAVALISTAGLLLACGDRASETAADSAAAQAALTPQVTDGNIVALVANTHQAEMNLAATARASAASDAVKEYAARMIEEHGAMKRALDSLAASNGITPELPTGMEPVQTTIAGRADTLLHTTGRSTDIAYIDGEAKAHGATLEAIIGYAAAASDEDLRELLQKMIPTMRLHQDRAIDILRGL